MVSTGGERDLGWSRPSTESRLPFSTCRLGFTDLLDILLPSLPNPTSHRSASAADRNPLWREKVEVPLSMAPVAGRGDLRPGLPPHGAHRSPREDSRHRERRPHRLSSGESCHREIAR
uniref:Uncharacterized protein n=1 Tax=Setaria viridis TaxID=4556 RepID=A0A4U6TWN7_SETVI|nr:hypothetical protein SEVIR_7G258050v2 [Setaria viridis]